MTLQIFPYIFGRVGGAPFDVLTAFETPELIDLMRELHEQISLFRNLKSELNTVLYDTIQHLKDAKSQNLFLALKRNIYNDRKINFCHYGEAISSNDRVATLLCKHFLIQQRITRLRALIEQNYTAAVHQSVLHIVSVSQNHFLKNGLIFSSATMFEKLVELVERRTNITHKKDINLAMSLLRYVTRSVAKTSPFSSFNSIFAIKFANGLSLPVKPQCPGSNFSVNNLIFLLCKKVLLADESLRKHLRVFLNPTIGKQHGELTFFHNNDNHEFFCKINISALTNFLGDQLRLNECITYEELVNKIREETSEARNVVADCLNQYINAGLVLIHLPVSIKDKDWPKALLSFLCHRTNDNEECGLANVKSILSSLISTVDALKQTSDACVRKDMIDHIYINIIREANVITKQSMVPGLNSIVNKLKPENIFFEDVTTNNVNSVDISDLKGTLSRVGKLFSHLQKATLKKELRRSIAAKLASTYNRRCVPLLKYYQEQYASNNTVEDAYKNYQSSLARTWLDFFQALPVLVHQDEIDLYQYLPQQEDHLQFNLDLFSQVATINGQQTLIINNILNGIATNISRFVSLYSTNIVCDIKHTLKSIYKTELVAELIDASIHNTNTVPCFTDYLIDVTLRKSNQQRNINLRDLLICLDKDDAAILVNADGKQVVPIDFSMESIRRKSELMKFVDIFGPSNSESTLSFLDVYENLVLQMTKFESKQIAIVPRLYCTNRIVLSRRKWFIKGELLHRLLNEDLVSDSFVAFDTWRRTNSIPQHIFMRTGVKAKSRSKPQYINLAAPVMFMLFANLILKCDGVDIIELTEMLPAPEHLSKDENGKAYVTEYIVGLYNLN